MSRVSEERVYFDYAFSVRSTVRVAGVVGAAAVRPAEEVHGVGPTA